MARYVTVDGVRTWYDERGDGEPLVLLHGGLTDSRDFTGNLDALADRFRLLLPERRGHGHTPDTPGPVTLELMARDTIAFLESGEHSRSRSVAEASTPNASVAGSRGVRLVGYSAGAMVALLVAVRRPDLVSRLVLISGAFDPAGMILLPVAGGEPPAPLVAAYAEVSPDGAGHFPAVIAKAASAAQEPGLSPADLGTVACRTLVIAGDDDIVTLEHTVALYRGLPDAELAIVPAASHLLLRERPALCTAMVADFLTGDRPSTMMPMRRAGFGAGG
ncbi:MAG TPA: alpha/beta hydrolase [Rugosimonospora sp.]